MGCGHSSNKTKTKIEHHPDTVTSIEHHPDDTTEQKEVEKKQEAWRDDSVANRLAHGIIHGIDTYIVADTEEARQQFDRPLNVIEGPLMAGMSTVGDLYGSGKMFLPEVIKSARVMKKAIGYLIPFMNEEKRLANAVANGEENDPDQPKWNGTVVLATVKGDVHDIGKNILGAVLECNNYQVIDLGVMQPCDVILQAAIDNNADIIGLSGLITPSLDEMVHVANEMTKRGIKTPLLIGGAGTSKRHAAVKIHSKNKRAVHVLDASRSVCVVQSLMDEEEREVYFEDIDEEYTDLRKDYFASLPDKVWYELDKARECKFAIDFKADPPVCPPKSQERIIHLHDYDLSEIRKYIDWSPFFKVYQLSHQYPNKDYPNIFKDEKVGPIAKNVFDEANAMIDQIIEERWFIADAVIGIFPANSVGDDIEVYTDNTRTQVQNTFYGIRQQLDMDQKTCLCQSDFIAPKGEGHEDYLGMFACTAGLRIEDRRKAFNDAGEIDKVIMLDAVADRFAEAFAELVHEKMRKEYWGFVPDEDMSLNDMLKVAYQGIRPAPGYPTQPDHREKRTLWDQLEIDRVCNKEFYLQEDSFMMTPAASVCALVFAHPKSEYFATGPVNKDQVEDYAKRRGCDVETNERWLGSTVLGYEP